MFLKPQDLIIIKHMTFKDNNQIDYHLHGRPVILINTSTEFLYYLPISSHLTKKNNLNTDQFFFLREKKELFVKKDSIINLKNIYKIPTIGYQPHGYVPDYIFYEILKKFRYYQENFYMDSLYPEIKEENAEMIRKLKR